MKTLERELEWIHMSPRGRTVKSKARVNKYNELLEQAGEKAREELEIYVPPGPRLGDIVIRAAKVDKGFGDRLLIDDMSFDVPPGACDCHTHIHGDPEKFPFFAGRVYTPETALPDEMAALHESLHMQRVVIVTPSVYGVLAEEGLRYSRNQLLAMARDSGADTVVFEVTPKGQPVYKVNGVAWRCGR